VVMRRGLVGAELTGAELTVEHIEEELLRPAANESTTGADGAGPNRESSHA